MGESKEHFDSTPSNFGKSYETHRKIQGSISRNHSTRDDEEMQIVVWDEMQNWKMSLAFYSYQHDYHQDIDPELEILCDPGFPIAGLSLREWESLCGVEFSDVFKDVFSENAEDVG